MKKGVLFFLLTFLLTAPSFAGDVSKAFETISWEKAIGISKSKKSKAIFVDVRTPEEVSKGTVPGATNVPLQQLQSRFGELPKDASLLVFCRSGVRSLKASEFLSAQGFSKVYNVDGGFLAAPPAAAFK